MDLVFSKYSGAGNDFILVDNRFENSFPATSKSLISQLCHRQLGIGADGIALLRLSAIANYRMTLFNADGSEAEMCGNGLRCLAQFIKDLGLSFKTYTIETLAGLFKVSFENNQVRTDFIQPHIIDFNLELPILGNIYRLSYLNTGVPHIIAFVQSKLELESVELSTIGPQLRYHPYFQPNGTNVNFAYLDTVNSLLHIRTYERGVEAETLACGTGSVAAAIAAHFHHCISSPIIVKVKSEDELTVYLTAIDHIYSNISLTGPAYKVFDGKISLNSLF
ncbi:MAG: dapF [Chlamydiales bacterium]|jgi:diaminopimelate epimerase|nr:dapF [Chlamydiales bacterium]